MEIAFLFLGLILGIGLMAIVIDGINPKEDKED